MKIIRSPVVSVAAAVTQSVIMFSDITVLVTAPHVVVCTEGGVLHVTPVPCLSQHRARRVYGTCDTASKQSHQRGKRRWFSQPPSSCRSSLTLERKKKASDSVEFLSVSPCSRPRLTHFTQIRHVCGLHLQIEPKSRWDGFMSTFYSVLRFWRICIHLVF